MFLKQELTRYNDILLDYATCSYNILNNTTEAH